MVTIERIQEVFGDENKKVFANRNEDHDVKAISLLRERIPIDACPSILQGAEHDILYLCDVEEALPYLTEEDLETLADCNVMYDEDNNSFAIFV